MDRRLIIATLGLAATSAACLEDLPVVSRVDDLRVLAIRAEPPEVQPGSTVTLDALVVDPLGRTPTYKWYACIVPEGGQGFFGGGSETSTSGGGGTPLSDDPYGDSCARRAEAGVPFAVALGEAATAELTIPAELFDTDAALKLAYGLSEDLDIPDEIQVGFLGIAGVNYKVTLVVEVDGRRIEAEKRVNVSLPSLVPDNDPNLNPSGIALHVANAGDHVTAPTTSTPPADGRCFTAATETLRVGETYQLTPLNLPDPAPKYVVLVPGTSGEAPFEILTRDETLFFSFFSTAGALKKPVSKAPGAPRNEWRFGKVDAGTVDFWMVTRDGRGGVSWCHEQVEVAP